MTDIRNWIAAQGVEEIECLLPDMNGTLRGKVLPASKFAEACEAQSLRLPTSLFTVTLTGEYSGAGDQRYQDADLLVRPDLSTLRLSPCHRTPTATVYADAIGAEGVEWPVSSRSLLKRLLGLYASRGWTPVIAPELEFYLTEISTDPGLPLAPPAGRSRRAETFPEPYGLDALMEYEALIEGIYDHAARASLALGTMIHESGTAQLEINFQHGDPLALADQVLVFKRIVRHVALAHDVYATFMAKPITDQPGSAMHLHMSLVDAKGDNLFADNDESDTVLFRTFVAGLQTYLPSLAPLFAPSVNSFRRMRPKHSAPINVEWGADNRSCGLRVPLDKAQNRRIENRLPGADANPYLAMAAMLIAGLLGIDEALEPTARLDDSSAYHRARTLPLSLEDAIERMMDCGPVAEILGDQFLTAFRAIKDAELEDYRSIVTPWERDHLVLKA